MNWKQRILALFGAHYYMYSGSQVGFKVGRATKHMGVFWRGGYVGQESMIPLKKDTMAKDITTLINHSPGAAHDYGSTNQWTPVTKVMKAWYAMLEDEE